MFKQILTIARNTFFESIRQPIVLVLILAATLLLLLASPLSAFTMDNDQRMLIDIGLATVFMIGMLLSIFVASTVLGQEIRNKTTLTIVSKRLGGHNSSLGSFSGLLVRLRYRLCTSPLYSSLSISKTYFKQFEPLCIYLSFCLVF